MAMDGLVRVFSILSTMEEAMSRSVASCAQFPASHGGMSRATLP